VPSTAIVVSFSAHPLSAVLQYKFIILFTFIDLFHKVHSHHIFTFLSLPQFLASPVIFTNWGKQGVTNPIDCTVVGPDLLQEMEERMVNIMHNLKDAQGR
jgi:hypothetical protein